MHWFLLSNPSSSLVLLLDTGVLKFSQRFAEFMPFFYFPIEKSIPVEAHISPNVLLRTYEALVDFFILSIVFLFQHSLGSRMIRSPLFPFRVSYPFRLFSKWWSSRPCTSVCFSIFSVTASSAYAFLPYNRCAVHYRKCSSSSLYWSSPNFRRGLLVCSTSDSVPCYARLRNENHPYLIQFFWCVYVNALKYTFLENLNTRDNFIACWL